MSENGSVAALLEECPPLKNFLICVATSLSSLSPGNCKTTSASVVVVTFRFDYEYEIEYKYDMSNLVCLV